MHPASAASPTPFPERLGRYELLLPIATGGMATVYLARMRGAAGFEREVAVKLMHPHLRADHGGAAAELVEEAKLASRIRHPNVVAVLDVGDDPHGIFLVMEYVEGETLSSLLRSAAVSGSPLPPPIALRVLGDVLAGLHAAHELQTEKGEPADIVHRDFSPQNILVGTDGVARLTDFGIAKAATRAAHTQTGFVKGKVGYMSPEQARGRPLDRRCDVWAAGVVAWEVLAGRRLHPPGVDAMATVLQIISERAPSLLDVRPDLPVAVADAVASALEPDVVARCPSADELWRRILAGWEPHARPADVAAVAEHVTRIATPRLRQWELRIVEILELRARMERLVESSLDEEAEAMRAEIDAMLDPSTVVPAVGSPTAMTSLTEELPTAATPRQVAPEAPVSTAPARPRSRRAPLAIAGASIVLGAAALLAISSRPDAAAGPENATPAAGASGASRPVAAPPPEAAAPTPARVAIHADAPIAQVRIDDRVIAIASPSRSVTVELAAGEPRESVRLEAIADDGRRVLVSDVAGGNAEISFAGADAPPRATARIVHPPRVPAPRGTGTSLLPSPYEKK